VGQKTGHWGEHRALHEAVRVGERKGVIVRRTRRPGLSLRDGRRLPMFGGHGVYRRCLRGCAKLAATRTRLRGVWH
jgi:hypothetical protein